MRIKSITFHNYRCFIEGTIDFTEDDSACRNINLILGPNGGGKTELLFSFVWVLYDFDFRTLKGKEATPYPLNVDLYRRLQSANTGAKEDCWIELVLEDEGITYHVRRTVVYVKIGNTIEPRASQILSYERPNHERSLPIKDKKDIELTLGRIIPKSTLEGIIFDGERMQKLSRMDNDSKAIIRGVIRDVSNMELLELAIRRFRDARTAVAKRFNQSAGIKTKIERDLESLTDKQNKAENRVAELEPALKEAYDNMNANSRRLDAIDEELKKGQKARELVAERKSAEATRKTALDDQADAYTDLASALNEGYLLFANKLYADVESVIDSTDVPDGLMASSIESILKGDTCICGEPLDDKHRLHLQHLLQTLPPNNINSTLENIVRSLKTETSSTKRAASSAMGRIKKQETRIRASEDTINRISKEIVDPEDPDATDLQNERDNLTKEQGRYEIFIPRAERELEACRRTIQQCKEKRRSLSKRNIELQSVQSQIDFYDKSIEALNKIIVHREEQALETINLKLRVAYNKISEDAKLGRRIILGRFAPKTKYQIIVYNESSYRRTYDSLLKTGVISRWRKDASTEEIEERVILNCQDSNSTGQNKINTLAFVKAILDYSNEAKTESSFEIRKVYPLLIDAPFGDIFEDNLLQSSKLLHTFSEQVILMLADESYRSVEAQLASNVSRITTLRKIAGKNVSKICGEK